MYFILSLFLACQDGSPASTTESIPVDIRPKVRSILAAMASSTSELRLSTKIEAIQSAVLVPKVPGRVSSVAVRIGDAVQKGDLLFSLEGADYLAGFQEAKAAHSLAKVQVNQAKGHLNRFTVLHKEGAVTAVQLEDAEISHQLAKGAADRAKAGFDVAKNRLIDTEIRAPFDGSIIARNVEIGELIGASVQRPPIMIADLSQTRFVAEVSESDVASIVQGQKAILHIQNSNEIPVTIERINLAVDPVIGTIQIEGVFNSTHALRHGQSAEISMQIKTNEQLLLPRSTLLNRRNGTAKVFKLLPDGGIESVTIRVGRSDSTLVPVLSGIIEGDRILSSGHSRLKEGDEVVDVGQE